MVWQQALTAWYFGCGLSGSGEPQVESKTYAGALDCFMLLLAWQLVGVSCLFGLPMASGICMEIYTEFE